MANSSDYRLGSIWVVTFDPSKGTEIRKTRPALIVSGTLFNQQGEQTEEEIIEQIYNSRNSNPNLI